MNIRISRKVVSDHVQRFIGHCINEVNDQLARGRPFFSDIARDGLTLYEAPGHPLARPKALTPEEVKAEAQGYY
jgi:hypothetical protein